MKTNVVSMLPSVTIKFDVLKDKSCNCMFCPEKATGMAVYAGNDVPFLQDLDDLLGQITTTYLPRKSHPTIAICADCKNIFLGETSTDTSIPMIFSKREIFKRFIFYYEKN